MSLEAIGKWRLPRTLALLGAGVALSVACTTSALAANYSLAGNGRAQIGSLVLPFTLQPAPNGAAVLPKGAYVSQNPAQPDPKDIKINGMPNTVIFNNGPTPKTQALFWANSQVFQVRTSLAITGVVGAAPTTSIVTFKAGGRTGPATFNWCPGLPLPFTADPGCGNPLTFPGVTTPVKVTYTKAALGVQFGGSSQSRLPTSLQGTKGGASVVGNAGFPGPGACKHPSLGGAQPSCIALFGPVAVSPTGIGGGPIGAFYSDATALPGNNLHPVGITANGGVTTVGAIVGTFPANSVTGSWGFPFTTGMVTITAPAALGSPEFFTLTGSDARVDGFGSISLVSGGVGIRANTGMNANPAWLNYVITGPATAPSISSGGLILLSMLMLATAVWMMRRAFATQ